MNSLNYILARKLQANANKKKNGFTLIELMVVVAIVGVLSAVGLPELLKAQNSAKDSVALQEAIAGGKTCSMDVLTEGTAFADAITDEKWQTVTGETCDETGATPSAIVATSESGDFTYTVTVTDGVPGEPVKDKVE